MYVSGSCTIFRYLILLCCGGVRLADHFIFFSFFFFCQNCVLRQQRGLLLYISPTCFSFALSVPVPVLWICSTYKRTKGQIKLECSGRKDTKWKKWGIRGHYSTLTENSAQININNCTCNITESSFLVSASLSSSSSSSTTRSIFSSKWEPGMWALHCFRWMVGSGRSLWSQWCRRRLPLESWRGMAGWGHRRPCAQWWRGSYLCQADTSGQRALLDQPGGWGKWDTEGAKLHISNTY